MIKQKRYIIIIIIIMFLSMQSNVMAEGSGQSSEIDTISNLFPDDVLAEVIAEKLSPIRTDIYTLGMKCRVRYRGMSEVGSTEAKE